jgi:hypothetical protein
MLLYCAFIGNMTMAGPGNNPVQVLSTLRDLHWEFSPAHALMSLDMR